MVGGIIKIIKHKQSKKKGLLQKWNRWRHYFNRWDGQVLLINIYHHKPGESSTIFKKFCIKETPNTTAAVGTILSATALNCRLDLPASASVTASSEDSGTFPMITMGVTVQSHIRLRRRSSLMLYEARI